MAKKTTPAEFFERHNRTFIKFGELFSKKLTDEQLINALAEKDLEKLAKVFKLVFEMMEEHSSDAGTDKLIQLIGAYNELGEEEGD